MSTLILRRASESRPDDYSVFHEDQRVGRIYRFDLATRTGVEDMELQADRAGSFLHLFQCGLGGPRHGRIEEQGNASSLGHQLVQERQPLGVHLQLMPVALPPGLARLATSPSLTGSSLTPNTIGMVAVAALGVIARFVAAGMAITSTRRRTKSAANAGMRSL
jgi:hypothetical protein